MKRILQYGERLRPELAAFIKTRAAQLEVGDMWGKDFLGRLVPFATAGKLLRGSLVCFAYEVFSGEPINDIVIKAAMSLELTHSGLLIHDDIIDSDAFRRGQPALHHQYQQLGETKALAEAPRFGINMALCGGDAALFLALELLGEVQTSSQATPHVSRLFSRQLLLVCAGQMQDIYLDTLASQPPKQAIYHLMKTKTASYTLALPLAMGATLAGEHGTALRQLEDIGTAAGIVFQIRDDELGLLGDATTTGKPVGADIREGKKTLLYYYLMKRALAGERQRLVALFGNPKLTTADVRYVQQLVRQYRIPQQLAVDIEKLNKRAMAGVAGLTVDREAKAELRDLINFCSRRQR